MNKYWTTAENRTAALKLTDSQPKQTRGHCSASRLFSIQLRFYCDSRSSTLEAISWNAAFSSAVH